MAEEGPSKSTSQKKKKKNLDLHENHDKTDKKCLKSTQD